MKIALCLHGHFNSLTDFSSKGIDGFEHIKRHILNEKGANVDVFVHSWDLENQKQIVDLYNPQKYIFEGLRDFNTIIKERSLNTLSNTPRPPNSVLAHLYGVSQSIKLAYDVGVNYDIVIKSRFDVGRINRNTSGPGLGNPYPVQCMNFTTNIEPQCIYMADWNHFHMGPADMWFYGDYKTMKHFIGLYESLLDNFYIGGEFHQFATKIEGNSGDLSNAIAFYKFWMIKNNLWNQKKLLKTTWE